jgi:type I restriction enzyme, S subunit
MSSESPNPVPGPPDDWRAKALFSVAEPRFSSVDKLTHGSEEPVRLCNYTDVYNHDYITGDLEFMRASATQPEIDRFGLRIGDVIITKDSETPDDIGIPAVVDYTAPDLVCGYHLALLRPDQAQVDPTFLAKQLRHVRLARYFGQQSNGLTRYGLPIAAVNNAPLWLPELGEQKAAGAILRLVDEAIAKTEAVIAKLRQVRAGLLHDLLSRGLDQNDQLRNPIAHPEQFQPSPLGHIPKEWVVAPLRHFLDSVEYGISTSLSSEGNLPVLRMNNLAGGEASLDDLKFATREVPKTLLLRRGDVLFNRTNSYEHVGRTGIWRGQLPVATFASYLVRLDPAPARLTSEFLNLVLNMPESQQRMRRYATPAVQQVNINPTQLQLMHVAAPKLVVEQERIAAVANESARPLAAEIAELVKLLALKSGLMTDLLTGRVRVPLPTGGTA